MSDVRLKQGDKKPHLSATLDGGPSDWTGATAEIAVTPVGGATTRYAVTTFNTALKTVEWEWTGFDTTAAGEYRYEWVVTFSDTDEMTAPGEGYETFFIDASFGTEESYYCTLSDLKAELGITSNDEDSRLLMFIDIASRQVDNICRRTFTYEAGIIEYHAAKGYPRFILKRTPLAAITTIEDTDGDTDSTVDASTYEIENAKAGLVWFHSILSDQAYRFGGIQQPIAMRRERYKVTYTAGYQTPNQSGTGAPLLPSPIRYATIRIAAGMHLRQGIDPRIQREHLLEASVWYSDTQSQSEVESMLRPYRRAVMV